ncbi:MAG: carboxypeptidase regulatory-like domain-containing protein [Chloroflexi bacterium]|nr:carboxypeptidase regulatory-like domain-containing protein [Chloroflexota bacterium]
MAALVIAIAAASPAQAQATDYRIADGWFFTQTASNTSDPTDGFAVVDDDSAKFWTAFQELGGLQAVGYPVTRRFVWDGFVTQVFQKAAFQWRPESESIAMVNVFDDLWRHGLDSELEDRLIPPQEQFPEYGLSFAEIRERRISLLDAEPALRAHYFSAPDPVLWYGLPQSRVREYGDGLLRTVRLQRAVLQLWTRDVPWAKAGTVTVANGGDEAKALGFWPRSATSPEFAAPLPPPPPELNLPDFYQKHLDANGIPVLASERVPDAAMFRAAEIANQMLAHRPDLRKTMATTGTRIAVIGNSERLTQIPEYSRLYEQFPGVDWDIRSAGGLGATTFIPVTSARENNLLCEPDDPYRYSDALVHELGHSILNLGVRLQPDGQEFVARLQAAFDQSTVSGLWRRTYAGTNIEEYWAEGVQSWFNLNGPPSPDQNNVNTRSELREYDPGLASLLAEVFGEGWIPASCHELVDTASVLIEGTLVGPDGQPAPGTIVQAVDIRTLVGASTFPGEFVLRLVPGRYLMELYGVDPNCGWIGYYGPGGFTDSRNDATAVEVGETPISGIEIRLPASIDELCG